MSLNRIGPVVMDHRNPSLSWTAPQRSDASRPCRISGQSSTASVTQLSELLANPERQVTIGAETGVPEWGHLTSLVRPWVGWYLLISDDSTVERPWDLTPFLPFSIEAVFLGPRRPVIAQTWAQVPNDFGVAGAEIIPDPWTPGALLGADGSSSPYRLCDTTLVHSTGALSPPLL